MILYIHVPFCTSRCGYCAFNSYVAKQESHLPYVNSLISDLSFSSHQEPLTSIFFGGGTPNILGIQLYEKIFEAIKKYFILDSNCEITSEANPNLITPQWCKDIYRLGVNRLSLGVQSFFEDKLNYLEREHSHKDVYYALDCAQKAGFGNLSIDLIYDTPLDTLDRLKKELALAASLPIAHLSAYSLSIDKDSRFQEQGKEENQDPQNQILLETLNHYGFSAYEVSNFIPKNGHKCLHNLAYWQGKDYIGCGAGAVGKVSRDTKSLFNHPDFLNILSHSSFDTHPAMRIQNQKSLDSYIQNYQMRDIEMLSPQDIRLESLFLGLRSEVGVDLSILDSKNLKSLDFLISHQLVHVEENRLYASDYFLGDEFALRLS